MSKLKIEYVRTEDLIPYANNAKIHTAEQVEQIKKSIQDYGMDDPIAVWKNNEIIEGHGRLLACKELGFEEVPIIRLDDLTDEQRRAYALVHNQLTMNTGFDLDLLATELQDITTYDMKEFGLEDPDDIAKDYTDRAVPNSLRQRYVAPPFSVLDARSGEWQKRKKAWNEVFDSGLGRSDALLGDAYKRLAVLRGVSGTSIFDPVLCEVLIHWFSERGAKILDPFAGGCVRGIVSQFLGRDYTGIDLSEQQIEANELQARGLERETDFYGESLKKPEWIVGNSLHLDELVDDGYDMILSCPPYFDLEQYSDSPEDLSNLSYEEFCEQYEDIVSKSVAKCKDDAFAIFVVGEVRDKKGNYRNFIGETIKAFEQAGMHYYNEVILITMATTLPLKQTEKSEARTKRRWCSSRKKTKRVLRKWWKASTRQRSSRK